jgi:hypothetical protein
VHLLRIKVWKIDVMFDSNWCKVQKRRRVLLAEREGQQKNRRKKKTPHKHKKGEPGKTPYHLPSNNKIKLLLGVFLDLPCKRTRHGKGRLTAIAQTLHTCMYLPPFFAVSLSLSVSHIHTHTHTFYLLDYELNKKPLSYLHCITNN